MLDLLTAAVATGKPRRGNPPTSPIAFRMLEGKNQIYRTQYIRDEHDHRVPYLIEDGVHVDEGRAGVGLAPLGECL